MRNLFISREIHVSDLTTRKDAIALTSNPFSNESYILFSSGLIIGVNNDTHQVVFECDVGLQLSNLVEEEQSFISISYMAEMEQLLCVTQQGLLMTINSESIVEPMGDIEGGILACAWSNDQEMLVIVTSIGSLVLLNNSFEVLNEGRVEGLDEMVSPSSVKISWRSDGENFCINYPSHASQVIRVYTKELELVSVSRNINNSPCQGLFADVSWNPDHSLIASVQKERRGYQVSFFEKNGLRHGEFLLPMSSLTDVCLGYNSIGDILAVSGTTEHGSELQLWIRGNYHWYRKIHRMYPEPIQSLYWDPVDGHTLTILFENGEIAFIHLVWQVTNSQDISNSIAVIDGSSIHLSSCYYNVSPPPMYSHTMNIQSSLNEDGIIHMTWASSSSFSTTLFVLTNKSILVLTASTLPDSVHPSSRQIYQYLQSFTVTDIYSLPVQFHSYTSIVSLSSSRILAIHSHGLSVFDVASRTWSEQTCEVLTAVPLSPQSYLVELEDGQVIRMEDEREPEPLLQLEVPSFSLFPLSIPDFHLLSHTQQDKLYLDTTLLANNVTSVAILADLLVYIINDVVPRLCLLPLTQVTTFFEHTQSPTGVPSLPLASRALERGALFIGSGQDGRVTIQLPRGNLETFYPRLLSCRMLEHCIFDSAEPHRWSTAVELMRRQRIPLDLLYDLDPEYFCQHAKELIQAIDGDRVNLLLSNLSDDDYTSEGHDYHNAFTHQASRNPHNKRNSICDAFYPVLKDSPSLLLSVITCLCTYSPPRYEQALRVIQSQLAAEKRSIDETVCELEQNAADEEEEEEEETVNGLAAMRWLLILVDPSVIYSAALSTYDMTLTLMVATLSQRDPREYRPFIEHLRQVPWGIRYYLVDKELKRWDRLLQDIASILTDPEALRQEGRQWSLGENEIEELGDETSLWSEAVTLMRERELLEEFVQYFEATSYSNRMCQVAGEYLLEKRVYGRSLQFLTRCSPRPVDSIMQCCLQGGFVTEYLNELQSQGKEKRQQLRDIRSLAESLRNGVREQQLQAAQLYVEYLDDVEEATVCYCDVQAYKEAIQVVRKQDREDLVETVIVPHAITQAETYRKEMTEKEGKLERVVDRLLTLRESKRRESEQVEEGNDASSVWSMASNVSGITAITGMTSFLQEASDQGTQSLLAVTPADIAALSRRADNTSIHAKRSIKMMRFGGNETPTPTPEKKKKQRIRAGSAQEEEALKKMVSLIMDCQSLFEEIDQLVQVLDSEGKEEAEALQEQVNVHKECLAKAKERLGDC